MNCVLKTGVRWVDDFSAVDRALLAVSAANFFIEFDVDIVLAAICVTSSAAFE
jgi:hypothetical protein